MLVKPSNAPTYCLRSLQCPSGYVPATFDSSTGNILTCTPVVNSTKVLSIASVQVVSLNVRGEQPSTDSLVLSALTNFDYYNLTAPKKILYTWSVLSLAYDTAVVPSSLTLTTAQQKDITSDLWKGITNTRAQLEIPPENLNINIVYTLQLTVSYSDKSQQVQRTTQSFPVRDLLAIKPVSDLGVLPQHFTVSPTIGYAGWTDFVVKCNLMAVPIIAANPSAWRVSISV